MTGPEHYTEAERLITPGVYDEDGDEGLLVPDIALAQVHATLALAAATALNSSSSDGASTQWASWWTACGRSMSRIEDVS